MSKQKLIEVIDYSKGIDNWKFCLLKFSHHKNNTEYQSYELNFNSKQNLNKVVSEILDVFINKINDTESIEEFNGYNPKNCVDKLNVSNEIIEKNWNVFLSSLEKSQIENINKLKDINAYLFYINDKIINKSIYLVSKKNPILNLKNKKAYEVVENKIIENNAKYLQFNKCFDFIVYNNILYTINKNFESIFNLKNSLKILLENSLTKLDEFNLIENIESFNEFAKKGKSYYKFTSFSESILKDLKENQEAIEAVKSQLKIDISKDGKFILDSEEKRKNFLNLICGKIKKDIYGKNLCTTTHSTPLNI